MSEAFRVSSEIGRLRTVLVHRPGLEVARLTPENKEALLFDDLLWLSRAREEHDAFIRLLTDRGVEVLYFRDLLRDVLDIPDLRNDVVSRVVAPEVCGAHIARRLRASLAEAPTDRVIDVLLGGLLQRELPEIGIDPLFADLASDRFRYVLRPLPNLLFMRDNAAWVNDGLVFNVLATPARERESIYMRAIYRHHPRFRDETFPVWFGRESADRYPASIEGGDILVLDEQTVAVGTGERTTPAAVETLATRLFEAGSVKHILVVHQRAARAVMHLDTVFTMVDHSKFNVFPRLLAGTDVHIIRPGIDKRLDVEKADGLSEALTKVLGHGAPVMVATGGDEIGHLREQWDDGNNTLAIAPGVVVAYARNHETNRRLRDEGVEVLELDSSELCRGRGGSRCMTQPLLREPV